MLRRIRFDTRRRRGQLAFAITFDLHLTRKPVLDQQAADRMIGIENIPEELRVAQVIGDDWIYPNDPRRALAGIG